MLVKKHPKLQNAADCAQRVSFFERLEWTLILLERRRSELRQWKEDARAEAIAEGRAQGLAEGHTQGLAEGHAQGRNNEKLEIARKMKARGRPFDEITEDTGLPRKTIEQL